MWSVPFRIAKMMGLGRKCMLKSKGTPLPEVQANFLIREEEVRYGASV
jgi:hypothetical protein